eukprot:TRINITY_DN56207_c0_g1_i1.p1 TRINITY_DN56207_c0_g1~~TRINITY_DN56207_c0_g1_i1.p1  ORF type:complete len:142 (-),score=26.73 TRINITY_DN56207_c0_g1_i1:51-476(-)
MARCLQIFLLFQALMSAVAIYRGPNSQTLNATGPAAAKASTAITSQAEATKTPTAAAGSEVPLGWTSDVNASQLSDRAPSYDHVGSKGGMLLATMAATYGALTVLAILTFFICADRQKHMAQLQAQKAALGAPTADGRVLM